MSGDWRIDGEPGGARPRGKAFWRPVFRRQISARGYVIASNLEWAVPLRDGEGEELWGERPIQGARLFYDALTPSLGYCGTMSQESVEALMRWGYEWFNREKGPPPTWLPDGEFVNTREDPDHATYRGIDAIRKQHQGWFDSYPDLHVEPLEIRANGDRVFVWVRFTGHGAESGAAMEMELAHVFTLEGEKTRRLEEYFDRNEALAAVGLSE